MICENKIMQITIKIKNINKYKNENENKNEMKNKKNERICF